MKAVGLLTETIIISFLMMVLSALPFFSKTVRRYSRFFFLLGTGALFGILFFDLLPDLYALGGRSSLWGVGIVWILYSLLHMSPWSHFHSPDPAIETAPHERLVEHHPHSDAKHPYFFLASMAGHCLASGILLATSDGLSQGINHTVFLALLAHKAYESLTVSSVLLERHSTRSNAVASVLLYSLSLPLGVLFAYAFRSVLTPNIAMWVTSLAAGTLLGCLLYDFLLPSLGYIRKKKRDAAWMFIGLGLTQILMKIL